MRIIELLAFLRELLSSELRALADALPSALDALREALQATVDQCVSVFTGDAPVPRARRIRHRHRRIGKRKRLSRMNASGNLLCATEANAMPAEPINAVIVMEQQATPPAHLEVVGRATTPRSFSLADLAHAHDLVGRASRVDDIENADERGAHAQAIAADIEHFLTTITGNIQETGADDDAGLEATSADGNVSADRVDASSPPLSALSDWGEAIPGVQGVAPQLPPGWNTDWKRNAYVALHSSSSSSEVSSVSDIESEAPLSAQSAVTASPPGSSVSDSDAVGPWPSATSVGDIKIAADREEQDEPLSDSYPDVSSSPTSTASSTSSCRSLALFTNGVSYRQLTQELVPEDDESNNTAAFYRAALQKLKEERKLRARLRAESVASDDTDDGEPAPTSAAPPLSRLRAMRVTPLQPQYDEDEDDESRSARKKKLERLRTLTTAFAIKVGQPLSVKSLIDAPTHDGPYFA